MKTPRAPSSAISSSSVRAARKRRGSGRHSGSGARCWEWRSSSASGAEAKPFERGPPIALVKARIEIVGVLPLGFVFPTPSRRTIPDALTPLDPAVWAIALVTILVTAAIGTFVPAMRASRVDPVKALRVD